MGGNRANRKRRQPAGDSELPVRPAPGTEERQMEQLPDDMEFEDPFEDEIEDEEEEIRLAQQAMDVDDDVDMDVEVAGEDEEEAPRKVFRPHVDKLADGEEWDYDASAYEMFHKLNVEWPSLSFDIIKDKLGAQRHRFPHTMFFVAGTQAAKSHQNKLFVFRVNDLHRTKHDMDDSDSDDDPDDLDDDPILESRFIAHEGTVNRVRCMPQKSDVVASWSDSGSVHLWSVAPHLASLEQPGMRVPKSKPLFSFSGHTDEGYAMDWSEVEAGRLATGDCNKMIHVWNAREATWDVDLLPYKGHEDSVEDIQWSPSEANVFASSSVDGTIKIWDTRKHNGACLSVNAHKTDVNVISWNKRVTNLLLSGADDGSFRTWDLRSFGSGTPTADFAWHRGPITSIEWSPVEESMLAVSSDDGQVTLWDLAVEADEEAQGIAGMDVPQQLLFVHQGQASPKELHWHPQVPGALLTTGEDGFNVFKTINSYHAPKR